MITSPPSGCVIKEILAQAVKDLPRCQERNRTTPDKDLPIKGRAICHCLRDRRARSMVGEKPRIRGVMPQNLIMWFQIKIVEGGYQEGRRKEQ
jgi:hypothetical protein